MTSCHGCILSALDCGGTAERRISAWHRWGPFSRMPGPRLRRRCRSAGRLIGLYRFDDYASGSGQYAAQALLRLSDQLRKRRGSATG